MNKKINELYSRLFIILKIYLFQILLFTLFRLGFAIKVIRSENFYNLKTDIFKAFVIGWQFDTAIICYALLLPLLIFTACSFIPSTRLKATSTVLVNWFCGLTTAAFILILFIDQYFYRYFQSHINILIFGLVDDDTSAVMTSVWYDYPIVRIILVWCTLLVLYSLYVGRINKRNHLVVTTSAWISITGFFLVLGMFFIGMRQSLGTFPLQNHDGSVSQNKDVNLLVINGVWALNSSFDERGKSVDFEQSALSTVKSTGYITPAQAAKDCFPETELPSDLSDSAAFENLFKTTPENKFVETNKPNVVFVFMESMSNYNMNFDSKEMNLLGSLRKHFNSDIVYRNFVSSGNATIQSLEYLMINTPISVTQSEFRFIPFPSAVAIPFKNEGFENTFITGGESSWRNLNDFVPHQGFASMKGKQDILADNKEASANHWGAYDEYLFDYAYKKLAAKSNQPKFLFIQTTTNHTPFDLPDNHKKGGITMSKSFKKKLVVTEELALKNLNCFQYANNCLGDFLDKIKNSALSKNTIVVVTGDHNNLSLFDFDEAHQLQQRGVPLYMYIPEKYKPSHPINTSLFGSHKDIFPSIYNIALSNSRYYSIGNNLLDPANNDNDKFFGINIGSNTSFSKSGGANYSASPVLYQMNDHHELSIDNNNKAAQNLLKRTRANYALSMYYILNTIKESHITEKSSERYVRQVSSKKSHAKPL